MGMTSRSAGSIGGAVMNSRDKNEAATMAFEMTGGKYHEQKIARGDLTHDFRLFTLINGFKGPDHRYDMHLEAA